MAAEDIIIRLILSGDQDVITQFERVGSTVTSVMGNIERAITGGSAIFSGLTAAVTGTVAGLGVWAERTANAVQQMGNLAQQSGLTVSQMSALSNSFSQMGASTGALEAGFRRMSFTIQNEWRQIVNETRKSVGAAVDEQMKLRDAHRGVEDAIERAHQASLKRRDLETKMGVPGATPLSGLEQQQEQQRQLENTRREERRAREDIAKARREEERAQEEAVERQRNSVKSLREAVEGVSSGRLTMQQARGVANIDDYQNVIKGLVAAAGPANEALKNFTGNIDDIVNAGPQVKDVFYTLADFMKNSHDQTLNAALAYRFFGRTVSQDTINAMSKLGREGFEENEARLKKFNLVLTQDSKDAAEDFIRSLNTLNSEVGTTFKQMGLTFAPDFSKGFDVLRNALEQNHDKLLGFANTVRDQVAPVIKGIFDVLATGKTDMPGIQGAYDVFKSLGELIKNTVGPAIEGFTASIKGEKLSPGTAAEAWRNFFSTLGGGFSEIVSTVDKSTRDIVKGVQSVTDAINEAFGTKLTPAYIGIAAFAAYVLSKLNPIVAAVTLVMGAIGAGQQHRRSPEQTTPELFQREQELNAQRWRGQRGEEEKITWEEYLKRNKEILERQAEAWKLEREGGDPERLRSMREQMIAELTAAGMLDKTPQQEAADKVAAAQKAAAEAAQKQADEAAKNTSELRANTAALAKGTAAQSTGQAGGPSTRTGGAPPWMGGTPVARWEPEGGGSAWVDVEESRKSMAAAFAKGLPYITPGGAKFVAPPPQDVDPFAQKKAQEEQLKTRWSGITYETGQAGAREAASKAAMDQLLGVQSSEEKYIKQQEAMRGGKKEFEMPTSLLGMLGMMTGGMFRPLQEGEKQPTSWLELMAKGVDQLNKTAAIITQWLSKIASILESIARSGGGEGKPKGGGKGEGAEEGEGAPPREGVPLPRPRPETAKPSAGGRPVTITDSEGNVREFKVPTHEEYLKRGGVDISRGAETTHYDIGSRAGPGEVDVNRGARTTRYKVPFVPDEVKRAQLGEGAWPSGEIPPIGAQPVKRLTETEMKQLPETYKAFEEWIKKGAKGEYSGTIPDYGQSFGLPQKEQLDQVMHRARRAIEDAEHSLSSARRGKIPLSEGFEGGIGGVVERYRGGYPGIGKKIGDPLTPEDISYMNDYGGLGRKQADFNRQKSREAERAIEADIKAREQAEADEQRRTQQAKLRRTLFGREGKEQEFPSGFDTYYGAKGFQPFGGRVREGEGFPRPPPVPLPRARPPWQDEPFGEEHPAGARRQWWGDPKPAAGGDTIINQAADRLFEKIGDVITNRGARSYRTSQDRGPEDLEPIRTDRELGQGYGGGGQPLIGQDILNNSIDQLVTAIGNLVTNQNARSYQTEQPAAGDVAGQGVKEGAQQLETAAEKLQQTPSWIDQLSQTASQLQSGGGGGGEGKAGGGKVRGPGGPTDDKVPIMASNEEFVMQAAATKHYGEEAMHRINRMQVPRFSMGGLVDGITEAFSGSIVPMMAAGGVVSDASPAPSGRPMTLVIDGQKFGGLQATEHAATQLSKFATERRMRQLGRKPSWYT